MALASAALESARVAASKAAKKPGRRDVWHLDEVVVSINGERRYLWPSTRIATSSTKLSRFAATPRPPSDC